MAKPKATTAYKVGANVEGLDGTLRALRGIDKEANQQIRDKTQKIAQLMSNEVTAAGRSRGGRDAFVAESFRATRERTPVVKGGAAKRMNVSRTGAGPRASDLIFGMEFGANQEGPNGFRFPPRTPQRGRGSEGYWIFPTARKQQRRVVELWAQGLEEVGREWAKK